MRFVIPTRISVEINFRATRYASLNEKYETHVIVQMAARDVNYSERVTFMLILW